MFIKRDIYRNLVSHLDRKEITVLLGPRQVGKTTLMKKLARLVEKEHKYLFLNLDIERDMEFILSQNILINKIELELGKKGGYVFIDEIQRKENAGKFLKGIYDMDLPYKFIVSGSGSLELKEKIIESLAGRKRVFEMLPVSFNEFVNFKTGYKYKDKVEQLLDIDESLRKNLLDEYLKYGGYPAIIATSTDNEKLLLLSEIFRSYIERDINSIINIDKPSEFEKLIEYMAHYSGYPVNYSSISKNIGLSVHTIKKYLWYMEKTFMIAPVRPFFTNALKEITKSPTYYFVDLGMKNFLTKKWYAKHYEIYASMHFQNFIYQIIDIALKKVFAHVPYFWRTKDKKEVDFVVGSITNPIPIEVKYTNLEKLKLPASLKGFLRKYQPNNAYIVNLSLENKETIYNTTVAAIPFWKLERELVALL